MFSGGSPARLFPDLERLKITEAQLLAEQQAREAMRGMPGQRVTLP